VRTSTSGVERNLTIGAIAKLAAASEHVIPDLQTLGFAQIQMSGSRGSIAGETDHARRQIESIERIDKQLEIRILNQHARGAGAPGLGISGMDLTLPIPAGFGES